MSLNVTAGSGRLPDPPSRRRSSALSFGEVLGAYALTYVDLDLLLNDGEDREDGEGDGEASAVDSSVVEGARVRGSLAGRAWSSLGALVRAVGERTPRGS